MVQEGEVDEGLHQGNAVHYWGGDDEDRGYSGMGDEEGRPGRFVEPVEFHALSVWQVGFACSGA